MEILLLISGLVLGVIIAVLFFKGKQNVQVDTSLFEKKISELETSKAVLTAQYDNSIAENQRLNTDLKLLREQYAAELKATREHAAEELNREKEKLNAELVVLRKETTDSAITIAKARESFRSQEEKYAMLKAELENVHKKYSTEFENIATRILDAKSEKFTKQNKENLDIILNPLKENIKAFEEKVEKAYKSESNERIELKTEIKHLVFLNQKISEEANNLAKALKGDNKKQGNWGEVILEKVLERSGLV